MCEMKYVQAAARKQGDFGAYPFCLLGVCCAGLCTAAVWRMPAHSVACVCGMPWQVMQGPQFIAQMLNDM